MESSEKEWFEEWFNEDYLKLYGYRDQNEADKQVEFLIRALDLKRGDSILDLSCGMGRHSLAFANRGFDVVGIDLSPFLITLAQEEKKAQKINNVQFLQKDLFHLENLGTFDLIVNLFTSFGYFSSDEENRKIFEIVKCHLKDGGKFVLDFLHPAQVKRNLKPEEELIVEGQTVHIKKEIDQNTVVKTIEFPNKTYIEKVKLYTKPQIESMLRSAHLNVVAVWNDFEGSGWKNDGDRQIFYCKGM